MNNKLLYTKINTLITQKGLSQKSLAKNIGYDDAGINAMILGKRPFPDEIMDKICSILEISKDEFLAWIVADKYSKEAIQTAILELQNKKDDKILVLTTRIDEKLKEKNLSRTALSKLINYDQSSVNRMITGKNSMSKTVISRTSLVLEVPEKSIKGWILADKYSLPILELASSYSSNIY